MTKLSHKNVILKQTESPWKKETFLFIYLLNLLINENNLLIVF